MIKATPLIRFGSMTLAGLLTAAAAQAGEAVSQDAAAKWLQHLTPLPREISLPAKLTLKRGEIAVVGDTNAGKIIAQAGT